jgi:hypothetical protein
MHYSRTPIHTGIPGREIPDRGFPAGHAGGHGGIHMNAFVTRLTIFAHTPTMYCV